jgi:predicted nucleic acid-binding protein
MLMARVSLDTQIIIAILTNNGTGHRTPDEWSGIRDITADIDAGRTALTLPTVIFAELLPSHHGNAINLIISLFQRKSVELQDLTVSIARRAAELRDVGRLGSGKKLKTVDSIFIATAELSHCDVLYSADSDIYNATGSRIPLLQPGSTQLHLLPQTAIPSTWQP